MRKFRTWLWLQQERYTDWVYDTAKPDWMYMDQWWTVVDKIECLFFGHGPVRDHCGDPDHDYCTFCNKSMPGKG